MEYEFQLLAQFEAFHKSSECSCELCTETLIVHKGLLVNTEQRQIVCRGELEWRNSLNDLSVN